MPNDLLNLAVGEQVKCDLFQAGELVDVQGTSKGKGFQGVIKKYNQKKGFGSHGSRYHRGVGSMGAVKGNIRGKNLPGQMGHETKTIQNLEIVAVDTERELILVKGSIPGPKKGLVVVKTAIKSK